MTRSLPPRPNFKQLKHQAKDLLRAHASGEASVCATLRLLRRFAQAGDDEVLSAEVALHEVQYALAMEYGFSSWDALKSHVLSAAPPEVRPAALEKLSRMKFDDAPIYLAQMVRAYVQALNHAGTRINCDEFAAATGWAFSFSYKYDDISPAFLALRGNPAGDGPHEIFRFLPERLGYEYEGVPTAEKERLWDFVRTHIDAGRPVLTEQWDGGLFYGYRTDDGKREVWFVWNEAQWLDIAELQPYEVCVLLRKHPEPDHRQIWPDCLKRAVRFASPHDLRQGQSQVPQGLKALKAYLRDVKEPQKDFAETQEWFCWAAFSRLGARKCAGEWLRSAAKAIGGDVERPLLAAAGHYARAGDLYERYRREVGAGEPNVSVDLHERARTPERIAIIAPILEQAIDEEAAGIGELKAAAELIE